MKYKFLPIVLAFWCLASVTHAQETKNPLTGTVSDSLTGDVLPFVLIKWMQGDKVKGYAYTDEAGRFHFPNVATGNQRFEISFSGYQELDFDLRIRSGGRSYDIQLPQDPFQISPVEVTGVRPADFQKLTGTATRLSPRKVEMLAPIGTQEALEFVPGVTGVADDGIGNSRINIGIRGLNPRRSSRTLVLEDGIPIQPALYVYSNMYYNPPIERIQEVEVTKGSSAIRYGPHTMGGVVNYITNRPRKDLGGRLSLVYGSNNYFSTLAEIGGFGTDKIRPELQLLYKTGDGFRDNNGFDQLNGTLKFLIVPNENRKIYLNFNANYENSAATYTGLTEYSFATNPRFNPKEFDNFEVKRYAVNIIQQNKISDKLEENTKLYLNFFERDWWREFDVFASEADYADGNFTALAPNETNTVGDLIRVGNGQTNFGILREFGVAGAEHQYRLQHALGDAQGALNIGGRFHFERFQDNAGTGDQPDARSGTFYRANNYETYAFSVFAMDEIRFKNLILTPGVRFEIFEQELVNRLNNSALDDATTFAVLPGLGLNYQFEKVNLFGGVHRGMTPPSNGTLLTLDFGMTDSTDFSELELRSETSWNVELGARTNLKYLAGEVALFYLTIQDMIAAGRGTAFTNLGSVTSAGLESAITVKTSAVNEWLPDFFVTYTFLQTQINEGTLQFSALNPNVQPDVSGNELPYAPNHNLILGLNWTYKDKLELLFTYRYVARSFSDFENIGFVLNRGDTGPIPSYYLFNGTATFRLNSRFRCFVAGKNLLDRVYIGSRLHSNPRQPFASSSSGILPGARRQINVGINYGF
ncbi:MAG: TonB-dependent receptor [Bacteroidota bacterium]